MKRRVVVGAALAGSMCAVAASAQDAPPPQPPPLDAPQAQGEEIAPLAAGRWSVAPVVDALARGEYRHDLDGQDRGLLVERVRLGADVARGPIEARVVFQDARALDLTPGADVVTGPPPVAFTGAYEAWAEAHTGDVRPSFLRVGRQPVSWGEGRILGTADWSPTGRSLDALRGRLAAGDGAFEALAAVLTDPAETSTVDAYGELFGARFEQPFDPLLKVEAYALARVAQHNPTESLGGSVAGQTYTGAARVYGDSFAWTWGVEGAYQLGHADALDAGRSAWAAAAHVAHVFERAALAPSVRLGASYASGDHGGSTYGSFDPILPDVHEWHGAMDLFAWSNEAEASARVAAAPLSDATIELEYRYARLARADGAWETGYLTTIGSAPGNADAQLGHEIDAAFAWSPWPSVDLRAGYSAFLLGGGARAILEAEGLVGARAGAGGAVSSSATVLGVSHFAYAQAALRLY